MSAVFDVSFNVASDNSKIPVKWDVQGDINGKQTLEDVAEHSRIFLFQIARAALKDEQSRGFDKEPRVRTDSRLDKPDFKVKPFGRIQYFARVQSLEALKLMYQEIINLSPVDTGIYINHNYVYYNAQLVARGYPEFVAWLKFASNRGFNDGDKIRFINVTPYAVPLEQKGIYRNKRGRHERKPGTKLSKNKLKRSQGIRVSRPNGAYYRAYLRLLRNFRGIGTIKNEYIPNGYGGIRVPKIGNLRTSYANSGLPYVYPSITVSISSKGIL